MIERLIMVAVVCSACASARGTSTARLDRRTLELVAVRAERAPRIDGVGGDAVWDSAPATRGFTQTQPTAGAPARSRTRVKIAFDDRNLYVIAELADDLAAGVTGRLTRRDQDSESDWFGVLVDPRHDRRTGRFFYVNAAGVQWDTAINNDAEFDDSWDEVWESAVQVSDDGWTAELRIPLAALRFEGGRGRTWGINFVRYVPALKEQSFWSPLPPDSNRVVSLAGDLVGLSLPERHVAVAITPYTAASSASATGGTLDDDLRGGGDARAVIGDAVLDLSVLPDFGQVEADEPVLNLGAFEILLAEKRPFFVEGADVFATVEPPGGEVDAPARLFHSRRIGGVPDDLDLALPPGTTVVREPNAAEIGAAAKLVVRAGAITAGILDALTLPVTALVEDGAGERREVEVVPATNHAVGRVRADVGAQSQLGGIALIESPVRGEGASSLVGGLDTLIRKADGTFSLAALVAGSSRDTGTTTGTGPVTVQSGAAGQVTLRKEGGDRVAGGVTASAISADFAGNDLGFVQRGDEHRLASWAVVRWPDGLGVLRTLALDARTEVAITTSSGMRSVAGGWLGATSQLRNYWSVAARIGVDGEVYDPYEPREPGRHFRRAAARRGNVELASDPGRLVGLTFEGEAASDDAGWRAVAGSAAVSMRPSPAIEIEVGGSVRSSRGGQAYLATVEHDLAMATVLFGVRDLDELGGFVRTAWAVTPTMSVRLFGQMLATRGAYHDVAELTAAGELTPTATPTDVATAFAADVALLDAALGWQYRPGSALWVVMSHVRERETERATGWLDVVAAPGTSTLLLKLSYRWDR